MNEHQNIERFFQEKFKDFEVTPDPKVWDAIEANLKKKKRRVVPIWWFSGGVAATLVVGLLLYPLAINQSTKEINIEETPLIVDTPTNENIKEEDLNNLDNVTHNEEREKQKVVDFQPKEKKKLKEKLSNKEVLTANHVVKISKKKGREEDNNITRKVFEGSLPVEKHVVKEKKETGKLEGGLPVKKKEQESTNSKEEKSNLKVKKDLVAEIYNNEVEEKETVNKTNKWSVSPVFGLVKNNSFSKESPLDNKLITSPTNGSSSVAYGVKIAYQLSNRWEIQSGVHVQKYDYTNNDVPVTNSFTGETLSTVDYVNEDETSFTFGTGEDVLSLFSTGMGVINDKATLTQSVGYIEVPVEVKYTFLNLEKFSSKVVTGFSSLFLNRNEVSVASENFTEKFGSIKNLNSIDFSGNFGVEFDYSITKQLKFNVNPMFKVQLNTFSSNSNGFKPYSLGLYSGLKYQF